MEDNVYCKKLEVINMMAPLLDIPYTLHCVLIEMSSSPSLRSICDNSNLWNGV